MDGLVQSGMSKLYNHPQFALICCGSVDGVFATKPDALRAIADQFARCMPGDLFLDWFTIAPVKDLVAAHACIARDTITGATMTVYDAFHNLNPENNRHEAHYTSIRVNPDRIPNMPCVTRSEFAFYDRGYEETDTLGLARYVMECTDLDLMEVL